MKWQAKQGDLHKTIKSWRVLEGTKIICKLESYDRYNNEANKEEKANAELIASAPEMKDILLELKFIIENTPYSQKEIQNTALIEMYNIITDFENK